MHDSAFLYAPASNCAFRTGLPGGLSSVFFNRRFFRSFLAAVLLVACLGFATGSLLPAQTVAFTGAQSIVPLGTGVSPIGVAVDAGGSVYVADTANDQVVKAGWSGGAFALSVVANGASNGISCPAGVAVDGGGNVYIADSCKMEVLKETPSGASYTQTVVANQGTNGLNTPEAVAVDASGNVYIADEGNVRVLKETVSGSTYTQSVVASGLLGPRGVAVDANANVYIADENGTPTSSRVLKETLKTGSYTQSVIANNATNGLNTPVGVAVDATLNVYIADTGIDEILKETLSGSTYTQSVLANKAVNGLSTPAGMAVDWSGSAYVADSGNSDVVKVQSPVANLGMIPAGSTSSADQLTFTFSGSTTLGATPYQVLAMGAAGQEFSDAGTGSCAAGKSYQSGNSCTVNVLFAPVYSGTRNGGVVLEDVDGNTLATALMSGVGTGPQMVHFGGFEAIAATHIGQAADIAVDSAGELYLTDEGGGLFGSTPQPYKLNPATNVKLPLGGTSWTLPVGIALDGAGNVYVTDAEAPAVYKIATDNTRTVVPITVKEPLGIALDGAGNLFVADATAQAVYKMTPAGTVTTVGSGFAAPNRVAVDTAGNLYVSDFDSASIYKITPAGVKTLLTDTIVSPEGLAVDPSGMIYVASAQLKPSGSQTQIVYQMTQAGVATTLVAQTDGAYPQGITLDTSGNLYIADSNAALDLPSSLIYELDRADPLLEPLDFPTATDVDTEDTTDGTQTVTFQNIGNQPLEFATPASGSNPSYPASFPENSADTNLCASATPLALGATCDVSVYFEPAIAGPISEAVVLTDNSLNQVDATQSVAVTGTSIGKSQTITFTPPVSPVLFSATPITLTATSTSGLTVAFSVLSGPGTVTGNLLTLTGVGTISIAANQGGGGIYNPAAQVTQSLVVNQGSQTITFNPPASPVTYGVAPIALSATSTSGLAIAFTVLSGPGTITGNSLKVTGAGTITVAANQSGNANYTAAAQVTQTVTVNKAAQTITFTAPATPVVYTVKPVTLEAKASSGLAVEFTVVSGPAKVSGDALTFTGVGTVVVAANQAGNANYVAATKVTHDIVVKKAAQTITFTAPKTPETYGVKPVTLSAKASSGLAVTFSVVSGPAKVKGSTLTITGAGTVIVAASQAGNSDYTAAAEVKHTIVVDKAKLTVTANSLSMTEGAAVPTLTYKMTGFVDADTQKTATTGLPKLTTTATSTSIPGKYPITVSVGTLTAKSYTFTYVNGTLTVNQ